MAAKKKHKLKKQEALPPIEGSFDVVGCDLSMSCPGFALVRYHAKYRSVEIIKKCIVPNRRAVNKPHGKILLEISSTLAEYLKGRNVKVPVRERAFSRFNAESQALQKVVGVSEMVVWNVLEMKFQEYAPKSVKKQVAGSGVATKEEVAQAIDNYCDHTQFASDDESDAVAVALTWLIENGYIDARPLDKYTNFSEIEEIEKKPLDEELNFLKTAKNEKLEDEYA